MTRILQGLEALRFPSVRVTLPPAFELPRFPEFKVRLPPEFESFRRSLSCVAALVPEGLKFPAVRFRLPPGLEALPLLTEQVRFRLSPGLGALQLLGEQMRLGPPACRVEWPHRPRPGEGFEDVPEADSAGKGWDERILEASRAIALPPRRAVAGINAGALAPPKRRPPLSDAQRAVYLMLLSLPEIEARTSSEIVRELATRREHRMVLDDSRVRRIVQELRRLGYQIENRRGCGYFVRES